MDLFLIHSPSWYLVSGEFNPLHLRLLLICEVLFLSYFNFFLWFCIFFSFLFVIVVLWFSVGVVWVLFFLLSLCFCFAPVNFVLFYVFMVANVILLLPGLELPWAFRVGWSNGDEFPQLLLVWRTLFLHLWRVILLDIISLTERFFFLFFFPALLNISSPSLLTVRFLLRHLLVWWGVLLWVTGCLSLVFRILCLCL